MDRLDRRNFLKATAAAASLSRGAAADAEPTDQGSIAGSKAISLSDDRGERDPLGLSDGDISPASVRKAIESGIQFLRSQQQDDGTWPNQPRYDSGLTPLCTLALLNAGCDVEDPVVAKSLEYLRNYMPRSTYTAALQTMAFCAAQTKQDLPLIIRNAKWIEARQYDNGEKAGMWSIPGDISTDHADHSMMHFAMLALHETERVGIAVRSRVWELALEHWRKAQNSDGSWGWGPGYPGSGSMTCAGIAALIIASGRLSSGDATIRGEEVVGCGVQLQNSTLERALTWLGQYFSVRHNPGTQYWHSYYLYSLERAGRMTARRFLGDHDWYREGARVLVKTQEFSGAWPADVEFDPVGDKIVSTSFSLMFLAKGRWPVVLAHLKHLPDDDWNRHRGALANLMSHLEVAWKRSLTYQVVDVSPVTIEELLESPVVFLNGRSAPQLSSEEKVKLRAYIDRGGFVFAERCCGGDGFDAGFRTLMRELFPEPEFELQLLPPEHPVWYAQEPADPAYVPELWGIDVGCRTGVVYCPADLSCYWELDRLGRERQHSATVAAKLRAARQIGVNVLTYATGREVDFKNPVFPVIGKTEDGQKFERSQLYVANVLHAGGCRAAAAALGKLLGKAADEFGVPVSLEPREVELSDPDLFHYHLLLMHGRASFELTPEERQQLRAYLERGGTVLADAICSSTAFTESFRREMKTIFPPRGLQSIPANDTLFTPAFGGEDVTTVSRRSLRAATAGGLPAPPVVIKTPPLLEGLQIDERYAVLFSPYDISCGIETESLTCEGYVRRDATLLAINVLLYSLNQ